jgi:flavin reductase (DIM6/NTAB) family NADH-FMN oxidoreductase RutF
MDRKAVVADFLRKCVDYANASIERKQQRGQDELIPAWQTYIEFTQHAIDEIHTGKLDAWFEREPRADLSSAERFDIMEFSHPERSAWLAGIISPRPLILASTIDSNGIKNLAPLTSVMGVSNTPPLFIASFSKNKRKEYRGTLLNMRETGKAILHVMPNTLQAVDWIDMAGSPISPDESEWDLIDITPDNDEDLLIQQAVAAIEVEFVEDRELPGAVARLAVMKVTHIWTSSDKIPQTGLDVLTQHGMDNIMPAPDGWSKKVDKHYGPKK